MNHPNSPKTERFSEAVKAKENLKLKERHKSKRSLWYGLSVFGIIGWSVVVPTLMGTFLGLWLDNLFPGRQTWTITFLLLGLIVGCAAAWHLLFREHKEIHKEEEENKHE